VPINTRNTITISPEARFFLAPESAQHRQYEALRAYFVEQRSGPQAAKRFGYTPNAFRVLCYHFRHDRDQRDRFFQHPKPGPHHAPARDRVRTLAVTLRKQNLSIYDIQRELAQAGHTISINALAVLMREEGFARLPRRRDDDRPLTLKPEPAAVANVRQLDLTPRSFRTGLGGLFLFVPLMRGLDLEKIARQARLPGSEMIPADHALRSLLGLKLIGKERKSHVMDLVFDQGLALFAGLNAIPKRSYLAAYSSGIGQKTNLRLMETWFAHLTQAGLRRGDSFDLDFHTVPANTLEEPLEKHYVSSRSRSQKGILVFLARDATERVLCYANAALTKAQQPDEILSFVKFWKRRTGHFPAELVFDSRLTTYAQLDWLRRHDIHFMTLRRRSKKMLGQIFSQPLSAWQRITLPSLTRAFRTPKVLDERIPLKDYNEVIRQVTVTELGHEEPTVLLTNQLELSCPALVTRYAHRMLIENGISEAVQFFHLDALSSMVGLKVDFDLQITLMASSLYRLMADQIGREYERAQAKKIFRNLLDVSATVTIQEQEVIVKLDKRAHNPFLVSSGLADQPTPMPWFGDKRLLIQFA
jgi:hypothetical protein